MWVKRPTMTSNQFNDMFILLLPAEKSNEAHSSQNVENNSLCQKYSYLNKAFVFYKKIQII